MSQWQLKAYKISSILGFMVIMAGFIVGILLSGTAGDYFGTNTKAVRDGAPAGDTLQDALVSITSTARWLEPLFFLGIAMMMLGIALEFSTIPSILKERGSQMSQTLPVIVKGGN